MCEFCTQHGEGKQWYQVMKNYSSDLLHSQLSAEEIALTGYDSRYAWLDNFARTFIRPAAVGKFDDAEETPQSSGSIPVQPISAERRLARRKMIHFGQVLPVEEVEKVFAMTDSITRMPCGCRFENTGLADQRYCFGLGIDIQHILGQYLDASTSLEVMQKDDAIKIIRKFDEEGLMHSVWTGMTPYVIGICNCDGDCGAYRGYIRNQGMQSFFRAEYVCEVDVDQCTGCKECMSQCQFGAQFYSSAMGKVTIEPQLCFGCGVCRAACPQEAISLIPRSVSQKAANIW